MNYVQNSRSNLSKFFKIENKPPSAKLTRAKFIQDVLKLGKTSGSDKANRACYSFKKQQPVEQNYMVIVDDAKFDADLYDRWKYFLDSIEESNQIYGKAFKRPQPNIGFELFEVKVRVYFSKLSAFYFKF
jgi:hypothetical protein